MLEFNANINNILFVAVKLSVYCEQPMRRRQVEKVNLSICFTVCFPLGVLIYSLQPCKALTLMSTCVIL